MSIKIPGILVKISSTEFKFIPDENLTLNTKYKMIIKSDFKSDDNIPLEERFESVFTTTNAILPTFFWDYTRPLVDDPPIQRDYDTLDEIT